MRDEGGGGIVTKMQCICMGAHDVCFPFYEETKLRIMNWILRRDIAESKITTENLRTMSHVNNLQNEGGGRDMSLWSLLSCYVCKKP